MRRSALLIVLALSAALRAYGAPDPLANLPTRTDPRLSAPLSEDALNSYFDGSGSPAAALPVFAAPRQTRVPAPRQSGPIPMMDMNPTHAVFLYLPPEDAQATPAGHSSLRMDQYLTNSMEGTRISDGGTGLLHMQTDRLQTEVHFGLGDGTEVALVIPAIQREDPTLDPAIDWVERTADMRMSSRVRYQGTPPVYQLLVPGRGLIQSPVGATGAGDVAAMGKVVILREGEWTPGLAARAGLKLPTGAVGMGFGSGTFDVAAGLALQKTFGNLFSAYFNTSATAPLGNAPDVNPFTATSLAIELPLNEALSLVAQMDHYTSPYSNTGIAVLDGRDDLVMLAVRTSDKILGQNTSLTGFVTENWLILPGGTWARSANDVTVGTQLRIDAAN